MSDFEDTFNAAELEPEQKTARGFFFAVLIFTSLVYLMLGISTADYQKAIKSEGYGLQAITGVEEFKEVKARADSWYNTISVETGFEDFINRLLVKKERFDSGLKVLADRMADNIKLIIYQSAFRISTFWLWFVISLPFLVASIIDAVYLWKSKKFSFGQMTIRRFHLWRRVTVTCIFAMLMFFLVPAIMGPAIVYFPPIIIILMIFLTTRLIKTYQKHL
ncbi:MAG: hypothetical protein ACI936_000003 [Paraglaciecola sp.]|jgi:hypothetical protein